MFNFTSQTIKTRGRYAFDVRNNDGISIDELKAKIPAIFAIEAHESRSARYAYIPTSQILEGMAKEGFIPVQAMQAKPRQADKLEFGKHLIRFRKIDELGLEKSDTSETILVNSHDGSSSYHLMNGIFRTVCSNGLISGDIENNFKIRHSGDIIEAVITSAYEVVGKSAQTMDDIQEMKGINLIRDEKLLLAEYVMKARYNMLDDEDENDNEEITESKELPFEPSKILEIRRREDNREDLYAIMNVVQENVIKGGITGRNKQGKRSTIRTVHGIDQNVKLNKLIWSFAAELQKIHR